jgi:hypothetical protein
MVVTSQAVLFAIKALSKLGGAGRKAYEDSVLGRDIVLPGLSLDPIDASVKAATSFDMALEDDELHLPEHQMQQLQEDLRIILHEPADHKDRFAANLRVIELSRRVYPELKLETSGTGIWVLQQWSPADRPATPMQRMGLALVDVGLEYITVNPGKIGLGGNADSLIAGIADNLRELLPDADNLFKPGNDFAEGAIRIFVQAGLTALDKHVETTIEKESVRQLSSAILKPLIDEVANNSSGTGRWYDLRDELLGPIAEAAIGVLATHQTELLGETFDPQSGIGAVTNSILMAIKDDGLADDFGREGMLRIYRASLEVAIKQPQLFVAEASDGPQRSIGQALLADAAEVLKFKSPPFNRQLTLELVTTSIESVGRNAPAYFHYDGDWGKLSAEAMRTLVREISSGLVAGVQGGKVDIIGRLFNEEQANRFFRILVDQVTTNPGMITGSNESPELKWLVVAVTRAMSEQETILLSPDDWLNVVASLADEVARNPGRLIKLDEDDPNSQLAYNIISTILEAAADDFRQNGRNGGSVLFSETLRDTIVDSLKAAAGNALQANENYAAVKLLILRLNQMNNAQSLRLGHREWRFLFRRFVAGVLDTGKMPEFNDEQLLAFLLEGLAGKSSTNPDTGTEAES